MSEELKPCPFCGSYNVRVCTIPSGYKRNPRVWYVKCDDCESRGTRVFDKSEAIAAWNTRAEKKPTDAVRKFAERYERRIAELEEYIKVIEEKGKGNDGE